MNSLEQKLKMLNPEQRKAVKSENQRTLILAGAGSGKTQVLTSRVLYLLSLGVEPTSILSVTFTNKAAKEMKKRIIDTISSMDLEEPVMEKDLTVGTFHGVCNRLLRRHASEAGLRRDFNVLDQDEQKALLKEVIVDKMGIGEDIHDKNEKKKVINAILQYMQKFIGDSKDSGLRPKDLDRKDLDRILEHYDFDAIKIYENYEDEKDRLGLLDFGDLILCTVELLRQNNSLRNFYRNEFRHILVDEFQDTNTIQSELIDLLHDKKEGFLFVVGDDDQSIYEWRGAKIDNILNFDKKYSDVLTVRLEQNYRSTNNILKCANKLISKNKKRKGKNLWSEKSDGRLININYSANAYEEAEKVAIEIKNGIKKGVNPSDYAILYRSNYISRIIESKLNEQQISYTIIGGVGFWSRLEIKDLMSYLTLVVNRDNNMAFDRIVNTPSRGLGKKKIEAIKAKAATHQISRFEALKLLLKEKEIKGAAGKSAQEFVNLIERCDADTISLVEKLSMLLDSSNLVGYYQEKSEDVAAEREQNLNELINAAKSFNNENFLTESDETAFISYAVLQSSNDKESDKDTVQLMTVHASKGLEFPKVFLMAWEDGIFPSEAAIREMKLEEERRLAYVAITRAEDELTISSAGERFPGNLVPPSRFIGELPSEYVKVFRTERKNSAQNNFYGKKDFKQNNWNKARFVAGYKIGTEFSHSKYGTGIIQNVLDHGDEIEITVRFGGMIGNKRFLVEKK